jgi:Antp family protein
MSSYQFVNSLASCYNGPGQRSQGGHQDTIAAVAAVHAAANNSAAADYYNANNYPANCYSPQVSPHYGPYAPAATPQSHHNLTQGGNAADYNPTHQHAVAAAAAAHQRLQSATSLNNTSPGAPTPPSATPVSSCKYADSTASSPQDLSTSSGNTPAPQQSRSPAEAVNTVSTGPQNQATTPSSNTAAGNTSANANPSQQSSSSSTGSSNNSSGTTGKGGSSGNPPQIYPWMKRVHLGQSEYRTFNPIIMLYYSFLWDLVELFAS